MSRQGLALLDHALDASQLTFGALQAVEQVGAVVLGRRGSDIVQASGGVAVKAFILVQSPAWGRSSCVVRVQRLRRLPRRDTQLLQDQAQRAPVGEPELQQVGADEGGEGQPPGRDEERAALHAQRERDQDEAAGKDADQAFDGHGKTP
jgi:hypothetical protein